jgi:hypothetical protein
MITGIKNSNKGKTLGTAQAFLIAVENKPRMRLHQSLGVRNLRTYLVQR